MADEDEVDILGDFPFENLFQKEDSRISSCYDGGVLGPQSADQLLHDVQDCMASSWLYESSQHCWLSPTLEERQRCSPAVGEERSSLNSPWEEHDSWSEKDKSLLEKGIELFGRSWTRVSQFVGTKTPLQVRSQASIMGLSGVFRVSESSEHEEEVIGGPSLDVETKTTPCFNYTELYDDMAIPASMEEVISVVTTAQPTVIDTTPSPPIPQVKRQKRAANNPRPNLGARPKTAKVHLKFPTKKGRPKKTENVTVQEPEPEPPDLGISPDEDDAILQSVIEDPVEERKPAGPIIYVSEGEVVRIQKSTEDSEDSEIDIDDDEGDDLSKVAVASDPVESAAQSVPTVDEPEIEIKSEPKAEIEDSINFDYEEKTPVETEKIFNFPIPTEELIMDLDVVTDEEKAVHFEFFTGRPTKTPARYLKIRNHILEIWKDSKPTFVSKTQVRNGLKNCGDVNAIGRIHAYLEQIGAINFGCEQAIYKPIVIPTGNKKVVSVAAKVRMETKPLTLRSDGSRPRKKRVEQMDSDGEGGYTITHDEHGSAILTKVYKENSNSKCGKGKKSPQNEHHRLVYCHKFSDQHRAPFSVILDIGALLLMDVHAHSSRSEVIGLLGGSFDARTKKLHISRAVACKSQSTGVQCDMCPVSQTEASEVIQYAGLEVVGWYHSHPTFLPNPSVQDMETQVRVQNWFEKTDSPFVGMIVAPYYNGNKTLASSYKCLTMQEEEGDTKPYQFPVIVAPSQSYSESLLRRIEDVFLQMDHDQGSAVVPFDQLTFLNPSITYLEKVVESARLHIDRCFPPLSQEQRSSLLSGIIDLCERNTKPNAALL